MRQLVTKVKLSGRTAPEVRRLAQEYALLLEEKAVPSVAAGYKEHQRLLSEHAKSFGRCDADLLARLETGAQLLATAEGWNAMRADCRLHEGRLQTELSECNRHLSAALDGKQVACSVLDRTTSGADKQFDAAQVVLNRKCQDATRAYVDQWSICAEGERFLETKRAECDSVQQSMHTANCARASQVSGLCDMYDLCRAGMALAYTSAKEAARAWERYHKAEWLAVVTIRCFAENLKNPDIQDGPLLLTELDKCEQLVANTTLLDLEYQEAPPPRTCTPITESPCVETELQARRPTAPSKPVSVAVAAEDIVEALPAEAVSFVQERIQRATGVLPHEVHDALRSTLARPLVFSFMVFLGAMALSRCMVHFREKHADQADGKETKAPLTVDALCMLPVQMPPSPNTGQRPTA